MKIENVIVSAFPGTGKSHLVSTREDILDLDSSDYNWLSDGVTMNPAFPSNYMSDMYDNMNGQMYDIIFVSSHQIVRNALIEAELPFTLIYPDRSLMDEYINRYKARGNSESFISALEANWDKWIDECENLDVYYVQKIKLDSGMYISDLI